ncbi:hypothetical protein CPB85DRAFT_1311295 [Mucidula mucida]|nr:hypothetical protein CPB85DRAFT_1311295 [Mucidula mucida]
MDFLTSMESPDTIKSWLRAAQVILRPSQEISDLPVPVKEWLHAFEARARFGDAHVSAVVEEAKERLLQNVYEPIIPMVLPSYLKLPSSIPDPPTDIESPLMFALFCSQNLCAQARHLSSMRVEGSTNHWAVLYNSLFSRAWRARNEIGMSLFGMFIVLSLKRAQRSISLREQMKYGQTVHSSSVSLTSKSSCASVKTQL